MSEEGKIEKVNLSELRTNVRTSIELIKTDLSD